MECQEASELLVGSIIGLNIGNGRKEKMSKTRAEHISWCKERALEILKTGDVQGAYSSMCSDLLSHDETQNHISMQLGMLQLMSGGLDSADSMKAFIEGFN